jgi:1,4-alpha-glucan branching enzyme
MKTANKISFERLLDNRLKNPHEVLGLHDHGGKEKIIRLWRPEAAEVQIELFGQLAGMQKVHPSGLFVLTVPKETTRLDYRIRNDRNEWVFDPYAFSSTCTDFDVYLFHRGVHYELYRFLGAHGINHEGTLGIRFVVWAPRASSVSLVGDFNRWDGRRHPMRMASSLGLWELFVPALSYGEKYKYEIKTQEGHLRLKSDPFAFHFEKRPKNASIVETVGGFQWEDKEWLEKKTEKEKIPLNIYEVHLGSWKKMGEEFLNYRQLACELAHYCKKMHYTHVELLPIMEHPLDESWGYQVTGFFAPSSRFGSPKDFQFFVNHLHKEGIGLFLDWVPAHFPCDDFSLYRFDGSCLYEHEDPRLGLHPHWNTAIFNYGRFEVANFLLASALFWLDIMHVDGLRVDAVASMLYLDYGRKSGEWIPNIHGDNRNLEAIEFLKHLNSIVKQRFPNRFMIAEESSAFEGVSRLVTLGGLGFDMKWNMGWMNDTLRYFSKESIHRKFHQMDLTFSLVYAFHEHFVLVLSHDEVVHGKKSLLLKMPGDDWQKRANLRLLYAYQMTHPGKKLFFMGNDLAPFEEWNSLKELPWELLQKQEHVQFHSCVQQMNLFYLTHEELWARDFTYEGFEWVDFSDSAHSVISFLRKNEEKELLCVFNFTPVYREKYFLPLKRLKTIEEVFNTDDTSFGGSGKKNQKGVMEKKPEGCHLSLSPLAAMIFEVTRERKT